jgi:hypothetical protein
MCRYLSPGPPNKKLKLLLLLLLSSLSLLFLLLLVIAFKQGFYNYVPDTNHGFRAHNVATILWLQSVVHVMLFSMLNVFCFEIVPVAIIIGITFIFTFHVRCISMVSVCILKKILLFS